MPPANFRRGRVLNAGRCIDPGEVELLTLSTQLLPPQDIAERNHGSRLLVPISCPGTNLERLACIHLGGRQIVGLGIYSGKITVRAAQRLVVVRSFGQSADLNESLLGIVVAE